MGLGLLSVCDSVIAVGPQLENKTYLFDNDDVQVTRGKKWKKNSPWAKEFEKKRRNDLYWTMYYHVTKKIIGNTPMILRDNTRGRYIGVKFLPIAQSDAAQIESINGIDNDDNIFAMANWVIIDPVLLGMGPSEWSQYGYFMQPVNAKSTANLWGLENTYTFAQVKDAVKKNRDMIFYVDGWIGMQQFLDGINFLPGHTKFLCRLDFFTFNWTRDGLLHGYFPAKFGLNWGLDITVRDAYKSK